MHYSILPGKVPVKIYWVSLFFTLNLQMFHVEQFKQPAICFLLPFARPAQYVHLLDRLSRCGLRPPLQEQSVQLFILTQNFGEGSRRVETHKRLARALCSNFFYISK